MYGEILSRISNAPNSEVPLFQMPRFQRLHCTTLCAYYPPRIEPKLCNYTLPNFINIVYQSTPRQRGTTLCIYFPPPIEPKLYNFTLPGMYIIVGWKNYHSTGDRCLHYFQQNCNTFLTLVTTGFELYLFPIYLQFSLVSW